ncbi:hypothetical protein [Catalinimonas niigatensis]|uniref:hypothetical protein n=1 Tax=Catalinimonas niigatensis TaxID=1397264 RepID=UPI00266708C1|nr:hypothetical protein [Catalinimonas niigatensis]WPP52026.1 hypothetical protein PZB72_06490 [Catalinimonas niigatensis]
MLNDNTIAIYVILDDILQTIDHQEDAQRKVNDALILTTALITAWYFGGNWATTLHYMRAHHCPYMLSSSRFNRRLHALALRAEYCIRLLGWLLKAANVRQHYLLDTFPVRVCHAGRAITYAWPVAACCRGKTTEARMLPSGSIFTVTK